MKLATKKSIYDYDDSVTNDIHTAVHYKKLNWKTIGNRDAYSFFSESILTSLHSIHIDYHNIFWWYKSKYFRSQKGFTGNNWKLNNTTAKIF